MLFEPISGGMLRPGFILSGLRPAAICMKRSRWLGMDYGANTEIPSVSPPELGVASKRNKGREKQEGLGV